MNYFRYNLILYLLSPIIVGYFLWRAIKSKDYREGFIERLGIVKELSSRKKVVVHCASVGESKAAIPLIERLLESLPEYDFIVTTTTPTGKVVIEETLANKVRHIYLPVDWLGSCHRFLNKVNPQLFIIMETELWPNLLRKLDSKNIPVLLANARLSKKSLAKYTKHLAFSKQILSFVNIIAAQYESDRQNFYQLIDNQEKVQLVGNIKFDLEIAEMLASSQRSLKSSLGENRKVWVAASIHPGEFDAVLEAHRSGLEQSPDLLLIGIPRHPEKFRAFESSVKDGEFNYVTRSSAETVTQSIQVVVADTMGEVMLFCGIADVVFVGGSLVDKGGHNPLEAVANGVPVMMGSSVYSFADICEVLQKENCLKICESKEDLKEGLSTLLCKPDDLEEMSSNTERVMKNNRGCVDRLETMVLSLVSTSSR